MKLLVDAQLPHRLAERLNELGHQAIHTLDLPAGNRTTDQEVNRFADETLRIVVTKDRDFLDSHLISGTPCRLLWVKTGNISNNALLTLFEQTLVLLEAAFQQADCVELTQSGLLLHQ